ncbi:adenosine kinase 2 isoform X1 [Arctopsyche grandis]|uniref:adenosine kinase 2 isoform X1 n=1 Tax=Arctopsyche grandis TaxID=121162 RepID=UPI00406D7BDF
MDSLGEGLLVGIGNPLLDISAVVDKELLTKYNMKPDDAIMAEDSHKPLYKELKEKYNVEFIAGGSVQNTMRVAQWFLEKPYVSTYFGCVGRDEYSDILKERASADGVNVQYQYKDKEATGTCAVLITGTHRSLCANLAAANCFTEDHLLKAESKQLINKAQFFYTSGFFLVVSPPSVMRLAQHAFNNNNLFIMNLSAPFVSQLCKESLTQVMPYVDILFGNETEMKAFSQEFSLNVENMSDIALKISELPKKNPEKPRVVIITQGCDPVLIAKNKLVQEIPVIVLPKERIVDTNGAGDAFTGGFLAQLVLQQPLDVCVRCGIYAASEVIQTSGCTYSGKPKFTSHIKLPNNQANGGEGDH